MSLFIQEGALAGRTGKAGTASLFGVASDASSLVED